MLDVYDIILQLNLSFYSVQFLLVEGLRPHAGIIVVTRAVYSLFYCGSVVDPDPYVFGPPGSGFVIICTVPDLDPILPSSSKNSKKNLDFYCVVSVTSL
jgi:hypothetical protein